MTIRSIARTALVSTLIVLGGCASMNPFSSKSARNEPAPLVNFKTSMVVSTVWSIDIGQSGNYMFTPSLSDNKLFVASAEGTVACVDIGSGKFVWRINAGTALTAGVGTDGSAVVVKAGYPSDELRCEMTALQLYNGDGMVQLLDADPEQGIMLLNCPTRV